MFSKVPVFPLSCCHICNRNRRLFFTNSFHLSPEKHRQIILLSQSLQELVANSRQTKQSLELQQEFCITSLQKTQNVLHVLYPSLPTIAKEKNPVLCRIGSHEGGIYVERHFMCVLFTLTLSTKWELLEQTAFKQMQNILVSVIVISCLRFLFLFVFVSKWLR